jgi:hypothetical protein
MGNLGFQEILLIFVSMLSIFFIPVIVIVLVINSRRKAKNNELRITELERRMQQLEGKL